MDLLKTSEFLLSCKKNLNAKKKIFSHGNLNGKFFSQFNVSLYFNKKAHPILLMLKIFVRIKNSLLKSI
jgi:hypothetical protein